MAPGCLMANESCTPCRVNLCRLKPEEINLYKSLNNLTLNETRQIEVPEQPRRPLPTYQPLSRVINPEFITFLSENKIDFGEILLIADFLSHFELVNMRKLAEGEEYSNAVTE